MTSREVLDEREPGARRVVSRTRFRSPGLLFAVSLELMVFSSCAPAASSTLRLNQIQYIGSHNSYHAGLAPSEKKVWQKFSPNLLAIIDYSHPPLTKQLDDGVRQLELDIYGDSKGGLYAHPAIVDQVAKAALPADAALADPAIMQRPGFKVMHIQDVDQRSNCEPLVACLTDVRTWSRAHPRHMPVFVLLETEETPLHLPFPTVQPEPFDSAALDALDNEIRSVFARDEYLSPDDVRGRSPTLNAAIRKHGWPTLEQARGKILFLLDQHSVGPAYLQGHASLRGRVLFTNATPGADDAAFIELNDGPGSEIAQRVREGYLVRTRTDADLKESANNDTARRDAMLASGAQILSTDFPAHEPAASGYTVRFSGDAVVRCNPLFVAAHPCDGVDFSQ